MATQKVVLLQRVEPPAGVSQFIAWNENGPISPDSDEFKITALVDTLVEHGRKKGVRGTIAIMDVEAAEFAQELQRRCAARLPNGGLNMNPEDALPVVNEETDKLLDEFWTARKDAQ
jgi:hypothetical protein